MGTNTAARSNQSAARMREGAAAAAWLRRARELLLRDGWRQYHQGTRNGPKCLLGAINVASHGHVDCPLPVLAGLPNAVAVFNDDPTTDLAAVLRVLDGAIGRLEAGRA